MSDLGTKILHAGGQLREPSRHSYWACVLQSLRTTRREAHALQLISSASKKKKKKKEIICHYLSAHSY